MNIELRDLGEIPDMIHEIANKYIYETSGETQKDKDVITAQYLDMVFRAGWQSCKQLLNNK